MNQKRVNGPTPNGGVYAVISFYDIDHKVVDEKAATHAEVVEFREDGTQIARTYAELNPEKQAASQ